MREHPIRVKMRELEAQNETLRQDLERMRQDVSGNAYLAGWNDGWSECVDWAAQHGMLVRPMTVSPMAAK